METEIIKPEIEVKLVGLTGPYRDCTYRIDKDEFLIGRSPECHLILEENTVSAKHARIVRSGDHYELQDLRSTNGTFVERVRIEVKKLRSEDRIRIDRYEFRFVNPLDVSRTVVGETPGFDTLQRTVVRGAGAPSAPPRPHMEAVRAPYPPERIDRPPSGSAGRALGGFLLGLLTAYLLGVISMTAVTFARAGVKLAVLPQFLRPVLNLHPGMHLHPAWTGANWKDASVIAVALSLLLGIILGGLITQNARRRSRFSSALSFALGYVLLSLLLQAASLGFNLAAVPMSYPPLLAFLGGWGNFALGVAYFFAVALALGWIGALLGRRER